LGTVVTLDCEVVVTGGTWTVSCCVDWTLEPGGRVLGSVGCERSFPVSIIEAIAMRELTSPVPETSAAIRREGSPRLSAKRKTIRPVESSMDANATR
jgi:hypothetical protein